MFISRTTRPSGQCRRRRGGRANARPGQQRSFITTIMPKLSLRLQTRRGVQHVTGRLCAGDRALHVGRGGGLRRPIASRSISAVKSRTPPGNCLNTPTFHRGQHGIGPTFARPGRLPGHRRHSAARPAQAFVFRDSFRLTVPLGKWFFRPVASAYIHDFLTDQRYRTQPPNPPSIQLRELRRPAGCEWRPGRGL